MKNHPRDTHLSRHRAAETFCAEPRHPQRDGHRQHRGAGAGRVRHDEPQRPSPWPVASVAGVDANGVGVTASARPRRNGARCAQRARAWCYQRRLLVVLCWRHATLSCCRCGLSSGWDIRWLNALRTAAARNLFWQTDRPALFAAFALSHACWLITYPRWPAGWAPNSGCAASSR
jgi:hypothetical protein